MILRGSPSSDLSDLISHLHIQCVSLLHLPSPSLSLQHHQSLLLTIAPTIVPSSAKIMIILIAQTAGLGFASAIYACSRSLSRSTCWLLNKIYSHSSSGDLGILYDSLRALHTTAHSFLNAHVLYIRECMLVTLGLRPILSFSQAER